MRISKKTGYYGIAVITIFNLIYWWYLSKSSMVNPPLFPNSYLLFGFLTTGFLFLHLIKIKNILFKLLFLVAVAGNIWFYFVVGVGLGLTLN